MSRRLQLRKRCGRFIMQLLAYVYLLTSLLQISLWDALKLETTFVLKFWITTKPVHSSSVDSSKSSSSSSASSTVRSKHSSKSMAISSVLHSLKSSKSATALDRLSVHDKLRKIGSMFSIKSARSEAELPAEQAEHSDSEPKEQIIMLDKGTQMDELERHQHQHHRHRHRHNQRESKISNKSEV